MNQILFPTAYSNHSKVAYRYAQHLAKYFEAKITLLHVYDPSRAASFRNLEPNIPVNPNDFQDRIWDMESQKLKEFASEMQEEQYDEIQIECIATEGNVFDEIMNIKEQNNFDLIIMGTKRQKGIGGLFGNTTDRVLQEANCSVFLVPPDAHFMGIDKILYGTAFDFGSHQSMNMLLDWCLAFDANLQVVHVSEKSNLENAKKKLDLFKKEYQEEIDAGVVKFVLLEGEVAGVIEKYVDFTRSDLLAIHNRKKGFFEKLRERKLTKALANNTKRPILVLKC